MPSPIIHAAVGYAVYYFYRERQPQGQKNIDRSLPVITISASLAPDVDVIPGILFRNIGRYHNGITHSLFTGFVFSLVTSFAVRRQRKIRLARLFSVSIFSYGLHILMDLSGLRGVMLFWPFSSRRFRIPFKIFHGVRWDKGIYSGRHLLMAINELAFIAGALLLFRLIRRILPS